MKIRNDTARALLGDIQGLYSEGMKASEIAKQLGISRASVYRYVDKSSV